jgi:hypothetical protein
VSAGGAPVDPGAGARTRRLWEPPDPGHPERVALPLHLRPVAAALFDHLPEPPPAAAVEAAMVALAQGRDRLALERPVGGEILVDAYRARLVAGCRASVVGGGGDFAWTPATAARHLGLRAVALHHSGDEGGPQGRRAGRAVEQAVEVVLDEHVRDGGDRTPGPWLAALDGAGRAVARAQAQRWAEQAVAWLPLRLIDRGALRFLDDDWWPGGPRSGRSLVIHGRRDLTVAMGRRRVAITLAGGAATAEAVVIDALTALAATLCDRRGRLVRVVRVHPASGEVVATDVSPALLERGVAVVLATAAAVVAEGTGEAGAPSPGPGCRWCHHRDSCAAGGTWLRRPDRRSMGLPLPAPAAGPAPGPGLPAS